MPTFHLILFRSQISSLLRCEEATSPRVSACNPPPMPDANELEAAAELEAARDVATSTLAELHISSSKFPPCPNLPALFRRCIQLLPLLNAGDPNLAARCCRGLLDSVDAILSRDHSPSLLPAIEVFAESVVSSDHLKWSLIQANCAALEVSAGNADAHFEDEGIMLELVSCHFISSLLDEDAFVVFLSALSWSERALQRTPEISLQGALVLVRRTFLSLPAVVQAHLLLLMSRCSSDQNLDLHIQAFQYAMNLYVSYLPALRVFNKIGSAETPLNYLGKKRSLSCIKDTTEQKLRSQIYRLLSFCELHSGDGLPVDESDIGRVIEDNQHIFHEKFRQQCILILKGVLSSILCCAKQKELLEPDAEVADEIICLAAALRVMGSSILHILPHFSQMSSATDNKHKYYIAHGKVYNVICEFISLLGQHETNELHRFDLSITGKSVDSESASMLMLAHFANLSTFCLRRLGFLWKGCIIMMIMATNLIVEEQSLSTFHLPVDVSKESALFCNTKVRISEVPARTKEIILQYKSIHRFCNNGRQFYGDGISLGTPEECNSRVGKADGQSFFECHPEYSRNSWTDILDYVECEEGKDYSNALMQSRKFKNFKYGKWFNKRQSRRQSTMTTFGLKSRKVRRI